MALQTADKSSAPADALKGKRILVTRAGSQASSLTGRIQRLGGEVIEFPTIEVKPPENYGPLDRAIEQIASYDWLIFTSINGVEEFLGRFRQLGKNITEIARIQVAAIGPETAKRLTAVDIQPRLVPKQYQAEGILEALIPESVQGKKILIPRAAKARDILPETLRQWGARVDVVEAYRTVLPRVDAAELCKSLREGKIDLITFTSSSTVTNFANMLRGEDLPKLLSGVIIACIGPITQRTVKDLGMRAEIVAREFTIAGMVDAMVDYFSSAARRSSVTRSAEI